MLVVFGSTCKAAFCSCSSSTSYGASMHRGVGLAPAAPCITVEPTIAGYIVIVQTTD
jgi:hypothetical protein